jgi:hypothetical protein
VEPKNLVFFLRQCPPRDGIEIGLELFAFVTA